MLKPEWIYYFIEVAKLSSTNLAAEKLYISQSTISRSIALLEESLNIKLFHRTYAGMILTEEGKKLLPYANQYLKSYHSFLNAAEHCKGNFIPSHCINDEKIYIYATPSVIDFLAPAILQLPDIDISNIQFSTIPQDKESFQDILSETNSLVLLLSTNKLKNRLSDEFQVKTLYTSKLYVLCASNSKIFSSAVKTVPVKTLRKLPFIVHTKGSFMSTVVEDLFGLQKPDIVFEPNFNVLKQHVINDKKITFAIDIFSHIKYHNNVHVLNTDGNTRTIPISTKMYAELLLIYKREHLSSNTEYFIEALTELFD